MKTYNLIKIKEKAYDEFLADKKANNETTFKNYRTSINYFMHYLEYISEFDNITSDNVDDVIKGFQSILLDGFNYNVAEYERLVKIKASGVNTHVRVIKTFLNKYLGLKSNVKKLKVESTTSGHNVLGIEEIQLLIDECFNKWKNEIAVRNSVLIRFLFNTGFMINEALGIMVSDLFEVDGSYYVKRIEISKEDYYYLIDYIKQKSVHSDYVFSTTRPSENGKAKPLSREYFNKDIKKLASYVDSKYNTNIFRVVENNSSKVFRYSRIANTDIIEVNPILK